jgi:hypothetical protein
LVGALALLPQLASAQPPTSAWWLDSWNSLYGWLTTPFLTIGTTGVMAVGLGQAAAVVVLALLVSRVLRRSLARVSARLPNLDQGMVRVGAANSHEIKERL